MKSTIRATIVVLALALATAACGESNEEKRLPGGTSVTSTSIAATPTTSAVPAAPPTTTAPVTTSGGRGCVAILNDGLQLLRDYSNAARGIVAPDESEYRARAQALLDEARSRGCEIPPAVEQFLQ